MSMIVPTQPVRQKQRSERGSSAEKRHFDFLHRTCCVVSGRTARIQAAHIRTADAFFAKPLAGVSAKPHWIWTVPLDAALHDEQHAIGEVKFWAKHGYPMRGEVLHSPLAISLALVGYSMADDHEGAKTYLAAQRQHRRVM